MTDSNGCQSAPIKLLKVTTNYFHGGTEGQILNLVKHLDRSVFEIDSACMSKNGDLLNEYEKLGVNIAEFPIAKLYSPTTLRQIIRFASAIRRNQYQIVHSYNFYSNAFAVIAAKLARTPLVVASIRDQGVYLTPAKKSFQKITCSLADKILVNANSIKDWLVEDGYDESKISVIKNGIDLPLYNQQNYSHSIRNEFGIASDAPLIVMLARLNPKKGFEDLIRATALLKDKHPTARYMIVGAMRTKLDGAYSDDETYLRALKALTRECGVEGQFIFSGHRSDTANILAESDISVLPSHSEGLSNAILEAMASGKPIIATKVGGNPELVRHEINGLLVPPMSPDSLSAALDRLLSDRSYAATLGRKGRHIAESEHSLGKMADDTAALYLDELHRTCPSLAQV